MDISEAIEEMLDELRAGTIFAVERAELSIPEEYLSRTLGRALEDVGVRRLVLDITYRKKGS